MKKLDIFASQSQYVDHLAPIINAMNTDMIGAFYVPEDLVEHASEKLFEPVIVPIPRKFGLAVPCDKNSETPLFTASWQDMQWATKIARKRPTIMMEHGVGITFRHPGYAGGHGLREKLDLLLAPNEYIRKKSAETAPNVRQEVIGTPKLDRWTKPRSISIIGKPMVCVSFHWPGKIAPEGSNALGHYKKILPELAKHDEFTLMGHGHPRHLEELGKMYDRYNIPWTPSFETVMEIADLYINDCSSTLYEFCVTGKPVIILNAPWFRRDINLGIRFWDYTDIGPQVDDPEKLLIAIEYQLGFPKDYAPEREQMIADLYPYLGVSSSRTAHILEEFLSES